jgi:hypothetical protein
MIVVLKFYTAVVLATTVLGGTEMWALMTAEKKIGP